MKKHSVYQLLFLAFAILWSLSVLTCATDYVAKNTAYGNIGGNYAFTPINDSENDSNLGLGLNLGAGYERTITDFFSLGGYAGLLAYEEGPAFELLFKPRYYIFQNAPESLFVGANLGVTNLGLPVDNFFAAGLNVGYKYIFHGNFEGLSLEPSIGYDFSPNRLNFALAIGYTWADKKKAPPPPPPPPPAPVPEPKREPETGLYIGIIGFNETLSKRELVTIDSNNKSLFQQFVTDLKIGPATGLYYAVDNAISMLEAADFPSNLVSVSIVTFTDGLDNISIDLNQNYNSRDEFRDGVENRIANTKINDLSISAYSVGFQGGDVRDGDAFMAGLMALATPNYENPYRRNVYPVSNIDEVKDAFGEIARSLYEENQLQSIRLRMTAGYDDGSRIRFTFDDVTDETVEDSRSYVEGTYRRDGRNRSLENVTFHGLNQMDGITLTGELDGLYVYFSFKNETAAFAPLLDMEKAQQWEYIPSLSLWQRNSEFNPRSDSQIIAIERSAVVILVLDCTTSLNAGDANDFERIKTIANEFLDALVK